MALTEVFYFLYPNGCEFTLTPQALFMSKLVVCFSPVTTKRVMVVSYEMEAHFLRALQSSFTLYLEGDALARFWKMSGFCTIILNPIQTEQPISNFFCEFNRLICISLFERIIHARLKQHLRGKLTQF